MKKVLLLMAALFTLGGVAMSAKTLSANLSNLPATSENTTWSWDAQAQQGTFEWSKDSYNSTELFGAGNYSAYTGIKYTIKAGTASGFRVIVKYTNGTEQTTWVASSLGENVSVSFEDMGIQAVNLASIQTIRLSGTGWGTSVGYVLVSSFSLEGPDVNYIEATEVFEAPQGTTDLKDLKGTEANWASTVKYPAILKAATVLCGNGDGSNESTHVDISDYDYICFDVTGASDGGEDLRVWIWDGSKVVTLHAYPIADYKEAEWTKDYTIKSPGTYVAKVSEYKYLKGAKTNWGGGTIIVSQAYLSKGDAPVPYLPTGKYTLIGETAGSVSLNAALADANAKIYDATGVTGTNLELTPANPNALFVANEGTLANSKNVCVNGNIANLELTDGYPFAFPAGATAAEASYSRAMSNAWGTVCLPFEMASTESCQFYTILGIEEDMLMIEEQATLPAGAPALVNVNNGSFDVTAQDVALKDVQVSNSTYPLIGTYEATDVAVTDDVNYYAISNNQFVQATSNINLPAFRAYFTAPKSNAANLRIPAGEATAIKALTGEGEVSVVGIYSANGVQQRSLQKGINVVKLSNGATQKILVK